MENAPNAPFDTEQTAATEPAEAPGGFVCKNCGHVHEDVPEAEPGKSLSELNPRTLFLRNLLAVVAALLFLLSLLSDNNHIVFKAVAYIVGALAYFGEILMLTDCFRHKPSGSELFMPYLFGAMYVILGISYAIGPH